MKEIKTNKADIKIDESNSNNTEIYSTGEGVALGAMLAFSIIMLIIFTLAFTSHRGVVADDTSDFIFVIVLAIIIAVVDLFIAVSFFKKSRKKREQKYE